MIASRAMHIPPFIVMDVMEKASELERSGIDVVHMEVGEPDFDTPSCIVEAGYKAMKDGRTHYTHSMGILPLREAICEHYEERYGVVISPDRIIVTAGTSPGLFLAFAALLEPGDEVVLSDPHYACYPHFVRFLQAEPKFVEVEESDGFQYRVEGIKGALSRATKAIVINSPSNPTGNLLDADRMAAISNIGPVVISDEIYHGLVYAGKEHSVLEFTDRAVVLNGFSKLYAMTGWRLGYLILPEELVRPIQKIHQNFFISANDFVQWAGVAALREAHDDVQRMLRIYNERRLTMIDGLRRLGFGITVEPTGAFYVLANAKHYSEDSYALAFDMLEKAHVGVAPGIDFGAHAEGYLRFSYATSKERIEEGLDRIEGYLAREFHRYVSR
ncbi:MAG: pyridoxal phosphate-dependent aminotransferase [Thermodesulfobacteriota bacterium]